MTEQKKKKMTEVVRWGRNLLGGAILVALLWLQVDIRDAIRYEQPYLDSRQNLRIEALEKSCFEYSADYQDHVLSEAEWRKEIEHRVDRTENDIYLLDSQMEIIMQSLNSKYYEN